MFHPLPDKHPLLLALEETSGPALILDASLRIVAASASVETVLGEAVPLGRKAPQVLCGSGEKRPVAEALTRGEAISAEVTRDSPQGERLLAVKSVPLKSKGTIEGHLLLLTDLGRSTAGVTDQHGILTASDSMRALLRQVEKVAPADASVLVRGETGAGKELVARALHLLSPRASRPFAAINCAALPAPLLESELFGHVRGAFTGAVKENLGHFRRADGGSLFLDEVAELPLEVQAKLLRVTQEKTVVPLGSTTPIPVNVRLISATHRSIREAVSEGAFRADLMYRLRVVPLFLPPLRDRPEDILPLATRFIERLNERSLRQIERLADSAMSCLLSHTWPGNVRELQNVLEYAHLLGDGPILSEGELPDEVRRAEKSTSAQALDTPLSAEARRIRHALLRSGGNRNQAAQILGISRSTLWRKIKRFRLEQEAR